MDKITEFLQESNAIENEYSDIALKDARKAWDFLMRQDRINKAVLLKTHKLLMGSLNHKIAGKIRNCDVWVGYKILPKPGYIESLLKEWFKDIRVSMKISGKDGRHFNLDHITFEGIHPFVDGNGRTGRLILNWERVKSGLPLLIIHHGYEQMEYYKWFD
jgi:Fic family protein